VLVALTLFPHIQRKIQEELDTVVGGDRLPTLEDRPQLPYLNAFYKEVFRWNAVTNTGAYANRARSLCQHTYFVIALPHVAMADDEYKGFAFKKGTVFFANVWCGQMS